MSNQLKNEGKRRGRPRGSADITTLAGVVKEMARLYREMRAGKTEQPEARTGVWLLAQIRDTLAVAIFESGSPSLKRIALSPLGSHATPPIIVDSRAVTRARTALWRLRLLKPDFIRLLLAGHKTVVASHRLAVMPGGPELRAAVQEV